MPDHTTGSDEHEARQTLLNATITDVAQTVTGSRHDPAAPGKDTLHLTLANGDQITITADRLHLRHHQPEPRTELRAAAGLTPPAPQPPRCKHCGCVDQIACTGHGQRCSWTDTPDTCTACTPTAGRDWHHPPRPLTDAYVAGYQQHHRRLTDPSYSIGLATFEHLTTTNFPCQPHPPAAPRTP